MAKLVRDRIPEIIKKSGKNPVTHTADNNEYGDKLKLKLREEVEEVLKCASDKEIKEELADVLEVINAICEFKKLDEKEIEHLRLEKAKKKGCFREKIILDTVD